MIKIEKGRKRWLLFLLISVFVFDQFTKLTAKQFLSPIDWLHPAYPYGGIGMFEDFFGISFSLNYVENRGTAWGLFSQYADYLLMARIAFTSCLLLYVLFVNKDPHKQVPLTLIMAGALGNITDTLLYGYVVDMIHFNFWGYSYPVFNVADACICIGVALLALQMLFSKKNYGEEEFQIEAPSHFNSSRDY